jgi:hypothetical protein
MFKPTCPQYKKAKASRRLVREGEPPNMHFIHDHLGGRIAAFLQCRGWEGPRVL